MQFNIIFKTIFEYIHKKFRFDTFCEYRKKTTRIASRASCVIYRVAFEVSSLTFRTCPSSVEITLERGSSRSTEPINLKIGLEVGHCLIRV